MDFSLTEDQLELQQLARTILEREVTVDRLKAAADGDGVDAQAWRALADAGLVGIALPDDVGGAGLGLVELSLVLEQIGRHVAPVPLWSTVCLGALAVDRFGTHDQRREILPGVVTGDVGLTAAVEEVGNPDPADPGMVAHPTAGGFELHGVKTCVPHARSARWILVPAQTADNLLSVFLVGSEAPGMAMEEQRTTNRDPQFRVSLDGVAVGDDHVLGGAGAGREVLNWMLDRATVGLCAMQLGVTERALELTADYTKTRQQFGRPIANFQAVRQRAADAYIDVEAIRLTLWQAVWGLGAGQDAGQEVATAKFWAGDGGQRVVHAAQHIHGGIGVDVDFPLHRYFVWAKQIELMLGHSTAQLLRIGRGFARDLV
jgi:3-oxocholest-4-en-26-oyl-CoA dehydrogenase beta subunit